MKSRVIITMLLVISIISINVKVFAKENVYYTNSNGIELTEEEYKFLTTFYWDSYVEKMTEEQFEAFANSDLLERRLITKESKIDSSKSTSHSTQFKTLKISAACSSDCIVSLVNTWKLDPAERSWDDIGFYFSGVSRLSNVQATVSNSTTTYYYNNTKTAYNGFGNSVLLPSGSNLVINQIITTTTGGHIYGSYQHAMSTITLWVSQQYNFSLSGYGNVFSYYGSAVGKYDGMAGVDIAV